MEKLVLAAKSFSDPARVRVLLALRGEELCVCELCDALAFTQSTLSTHLQVIRKAGLVTARKEGKWMYYCISPEAKRLVDMLFDFFEPTLQVSAIKRDAKRLRQRLSLRANGCCCVGFPSSRTNCKSQLKPS